MNTVGLLVILVLGLLASLVLTAQIIPILQHKQMGQNIREDGPQSHKAKQGTPSMGGIAIVISTMLAAFVAGNITTDTWMIMGGFLGFALIGFSDDYLKVVKKQNEGLSPSQKFFMQAILAFGAAAYVVYVSEATYNLYIPFIRTTIATSNHPITYMCFIAFTIIAMSNGVNLTDGLDGLASSVTVAVSIPMAFLLLDIVGMGATPGASFFAALSGACLGFLAFNKNPAKVFMGDTGSLAIGGGMAIAACVYGIEIFLPIMGIIFVLEVVSVILQVLYFKATGGKRLFKMAPLHHHFEESGMNEIKVVKMFFAITCLISGIMLIIK